MVKSGSDFCFITFYSLLSRKVNLAINSATCSHVEELNRETSPLIPVR